MNHMNHYENKHLWDACFLRQPCIQWNAAQQEAKQKELASRFLLSTIWVEETARMASTSKRNSAGTRFSKLIRFVSIKVESGFNPLLLIYNTPADKAFVVNNRWKPRENSILKN